MEEDGIQMTAHRVYRIEKHSMEDYPVGLDNFRSSHDRTRLGNSGDLDPGPIQFRHRSADLLVTRWGPRTYPSATHSAVYQAASSFSSTPICQTVPICVFQ